MVTGRGSAPGAAAGDGAGESTFLGSRRLLLFLGGGVLAAAATAVLGAPEIAVLVGWVLAAGGLLLRVWRIGWPQDHRGTKRLAEEEGRTRATDAAVLGAAVISLGAVAQGLVQAQSRDLLGIVTVILCVLTVVLSWSLVNTVFALKYARHYYAGGDGGIDFGQGEAPTYSDFAYLAFTVGMSFGVADTQLVTTPIRKVGLGHALLSYLFGTVVIAVAVNLVTNLGQSG
ncbi:DUF1345 domain-containing protein [Cellulomonas sp. PS-H5]|uniref:DUF1345 domain-containing protein n=1 Tax=Cellulomonas sp. PS-H5 TaxID=2820400 RepID=UPI001C4F2920|nr:DUF1345 domain-containing protein [Cellulomonas sp. PS-H5]MBW0252836.1 DUF1345 domain-containing protein [Cellulomonas sp. PS-H5]